MNNKNEIVDLFNNSKIKTPFIKEIYEINQFIVKRILKQNNKMEIFENK